MRKGQAFGTLVFLVVLAFVLWQARSQIHQPIEQPSVKIPVVEQEPEVIPEEPPQMHENPFESTTADDSIEFSNLLPPAPYDRRPFMSMLLKGKAPDEVLVKWPADGVLKILLDVATKPESRVVDKVKLDAASKSAIVTISLADLNDDGLEQLFPGADIEKTRASLRLDDRMTFTIGELVDPKMDKVVGLWVSPNSE